ncbi:MAG TPA: nucleotidyl transferase AbiEii/AbiGii toxin family protein [Dermatophilaceae bacterium]|nr:nucleotidyl transferase AbiEii/AbiGii toxin family protein [Dermatophilaceae bacterium]
MLEGFLSRLAVSDMRDGFVLKGGVLLSAFDSRRPTKDVDLAGRALRRNTARMVTQ